MAAGVAFYAAVGPLLTRYEVDVDAATLAARDGVTLPANVQYAWPHRDGRILYVASSNGGPSLGPLGDTHHVSAFRVAPGSGALTPHGAPVALPGRPIHMATDIPSEHLLVAFSNPADLAVHRINPDGTPGARLPQPQAIDPGVMPHQIRATPDNRQVIAVARGHDAAAGKPEEPGSLKLFDYRDGLLTGERSIAPAGGYGFGPRHLDFHPTQPWLYVSLERQNQLALFDRPGGTLAPAPRVRRDTLARPDAPDNRQIVGTVHVHPAGHVVYVANRASDTTEIDGRAVMAGGENSLCVFAIDPQTGVPTLVQRIDTEGVHPRTFHIDPSGRLLVVGHILGRAVRRGGAVVDVPTRLSVFRIAADGTLAFARAYDVATGDRMLWWSGMVPL